MKSISAKYFECTLKYDKTQETGLIKKVSETNVVDALSFAEAEKRFIEEMAPYVTREFEVTAIKVAPYKEVFFSDDNNDDRWYKAKVSFITLNERTGQEKRTNVTYLVQAATLDGAIRNIDLAMKGTLGDYASIFVSETKIYDVFLYNKEN